MIDIYVNWAARFSWLFPIMRPFLAGVVCGILTAWALIAHFAPPPVARKYHEHFGGHPKNRHS